MLYVYYHFMRFTKDQLRKVKRQKEKFTENSQLKGEEKMGMTKQTVTEKKKATACKKRNVNFQAADF